MSTHIQAMNEEAKKNAVTMMTTLQSQGVFKRWITIDDPWQPDLTQLHLFGTLSDISGKFNTAARRQVRCSPHLHAFITGHTSYAQPVTGPSPEAALAALLKHCLVRPHIMFKDAHSPYQLLCSSHMILDMAFVRAVMTASAWLGPDAMPTGYIHNWPPPEGDARL